MLRLREVREKELGLTLEGAVELLSKQVKKDVSTISRHECEKGIDLKDLKMYAKAYHRHIAEFFVGAAILTDTENQVLGMFRKLSGPQQDAVISMMTVIVGEPPSKNDSPVNRENPGRPIPGTSAKVG